MDLWPDLRQGARSLRQQPGFAAAALLTLALGIGASTAIFSVVDGVLLRPLPYAAPERLVLLKETNPPRFPELVVRPARYREWREQITSLEGLAAVRTRSYNLTGAGEPIRISAAVMAAVVSLVGALACLVPARRASAVDPVTAPRSG